MPEAIPVYSPLVGEEEWVNVRECLETTWISSRGRFVEAFERGVADYVGARHGIAVSNGTVALHLAMLALGIGPGDHVAVPTFTYIAPVNAIRYVGAEPVFVDSDPDTLQISAADLERRAAQQQLRAVIVVHLYGQPADMSALTRIAKANSFTIIEDCAEAFGSRIEHRHVGSFGNIATYSFFGNKTITTGEGGMVTTDSDVLAKCIRKLRGQGLAEGREYWHDVIGYNYRMTNICAAIGVAQLHRSSYILQRKREIAAFYRAALDGLPVKFHDEVPGTTHSFWMCSIFAHTAQERDSLRECLKADSIETRPCFFPIHTMPMYQKWDRGDYPVSKEVPYRGLNLPSFPSLTQEELGRICTAIASFYRR